MKIEPLYQLATRTLLFLRTDTERRMDPPPTTTGKKKRVLKLAPGEELPPPNATTSVVVVQQQAPKAAPPKPESKEEEAAVTPAAEAKPPEAKPTEAKPADAKPKGKGTRSRKFKVVEEAKAEDLTYDQVIKRFYDARQKDPQSYTYTPEGNLVEKKDGVERSTVPLRRFRVLTQEEQNAIDEERNAKIVEQENKVDLAMTKLRAAYEQYENGRGTLRTIFLANKEVTQEQERLTQIKYPKRIIDNLDGLQYRNIRFDMRGDERALGFDVFVLKKAEYPMESLYGRYMTPEEEEALKLQKQSGGRSTEVYILESAEDPDMGGFHPSFTKDFSYSSTQYASPLQAFEVERIRALKNDALVDQLLKTRSARTIHNLAQQEKTPAPNAFELWTGILKAYYQQDKQWADKLKATGDALFILRDTTIPSSQEFLRALLAVRASLREGDEQQVTGDVVKRAITEEEQQKAKVAAIIRNRQAHRG